MLSRGNVPKSFELMRKWGVLPILVRDDAGDAPNDIQIEIGCKIMKSLRDGMHALNWRDVDTKVAYLAAFCQPVRGAPYVGRCNPIEYLVKEKLKLPNKLATGARVVVEGSASFESTIRNLPSDIPTLRVTLGRVIRNIGPLWKESLLLAMADEALRSDAYVSGDLINKYSDLLRTISELKLQDAYDIKAPITGKELMDLLPGLKPGPQFKEALDVQVNHLLMHPELSRDQLAQFILKTFGEKGEFTPK